MVAGAPFFLGEGDGVTLGVSSAPGVRGRARRRFRRFLRCWSRRRRRLAFLLRRSARRRIRGRRRRDFFFFFGEADALGSGFLGGSGTRGDFLFLRRRGRRRFLRSGRWFWRRRLFRFLFFFGAVDEVLRCFRGAGVGVGAKIFLILLPNDSSARARSATPRSIAIKRNHGTRRMALKRVPPILRTRRMERVGLARSTSSPTPPEPLCSSECRHPCFRAENSRSANAPGNQEAQDQAEASRLREWCEIARRSGCCLPRG